MVFLQLNQETILEVHAFKATTCMQNALALETEEAVGKVQTAAAGDFLEILIREPIAVDTAV